jgi:hypothetical protein
MLLAYIGIDIQYQRLLRILRVQPFGTSGRNFSHLAQIGVEVVYRTGAMSTLDEIIGSGRPCIALVRSGLLSYWSYSTDHAVVVVGIDDNAIYINDPAFVQSPMQVTRLEFDLAWMEFDYRYCIMTTGNTPRA